MTATSCELSIRGRVVLSRQRQSAGIGPRGSCWVRGRVVGGSALRVL